MKIYTCCQHAECRTYAEAISFLLRFGIEPGFGTDDDGCYLEFELPKGRKGASRFWRELVQRTSLRDQV